MAGEREKTGHTAHPQPKLLSLGLIQYLLAHSMIQVLQFLLFKIL